MGWLIHQVRPTSHGSEMRSRFFLNDPELLDLPARSLRRRGAGLLTGKAVRKLGDHALSHLTPKMLGPDFGHHMTFHCASEMNHLASFLPDLYDEFNGTP